jgi:hypothetical protein
MGKADHYIHGDYNIICDRCGFKIKRSEALKTWDNLLVCKKDWEPRHPQDFVRGKADRQRVADARPDTVSNMSVTTVKVAGFLDDTTIDVNDISNIAQYDSIGIALDNEIVQWTYVSEIPSGDTVTLNDSLQGSVSVGNTVYIPGVTGDTFLSTNEVSVDDL